MYNYGRLRREFDRKGVDKSKFNSDLTVNNLGSADWGRVAEKYRQAYYIKATGGTNKEGDEVGWYVHQLDDLQTPYGSHLLGWLDQYITIVSRVCREEFLKLPVVDFRKKLIAGKGKKRSYFTNSILIEGINDQTYHDVKAPALYPGKITKRIFKKLLREYDKAIKELSNLPEEEQTAILLTGLPPEKNIGYPYFGRQSKKTFAKVFYDACKAVYGKGFDFTIKGLLDFIDYVANMDIVHVYLVFYRTKDEDVARLVCGGNVILKGIGCLFAVLRKVAGFEVPVVDKLPFVSWMDWSQLFPLIDDVMRKVDSKNYEAIGEDIINFDGKVKPYDLDWISDFTGVALKFLKFVLKGMKTAKLYYGPYAIKGVFFMSGNPFTQLFGTLIHLCLSEIYAELCGVRILDGIWQSDDDLVMYDNASLEDINNVFTKFGYPVNIKDKSHSWLRDKVVQYLKVYIGYIFTDEEISHIGNPVSRYLNMIHRERGSPEIFYSFPTTDNVNMLISQTASFSDNAVLIVKEIYNELKFTEIGAEAIRILTKYKLGQISYEDIRPDLSISFKPDWLANVI